MNEEMNTQKIIDEINRGMVNTYNRTNLVVIKTEKSWFQVKQRKWYLDLLQNYASKCLGGCHPEIVEAVIAQVQQMDSISGTLYHEGLTWVGELAELCGYDMGLPMNVGAEAVEKAAKTARKYAYTEMGIPWGEARIISAGGGEPSVCFHGRTFFAMSLSGNHHYTDDFVPLIPNIDKIPFNDIPALEGMIKKNDGTTCAYIAEPVPVEGGIIIPDPGYLQECRKICNEYGGLLILDEIQTGFGRTGKTLCQEHSKIKADMVTMGKGISNGVSPASGVFGNKGIVDIMSAGQDGSTYAGNPLVSAIVGKVIEIYKRDRLDEVAAKTGKYFLTRLNEDIGKFDAVIKDIRGMGLLIAIELEPSVKGGAKKFGEKLLKQRIFTQKATDTVMRITPALNIEEDDIEFAINGNGTTVNGIKKVVKSYY